MIKKLNRIPELTLLPVALAVRLLGIISRPIWYDEAFALLFSAAGPARMAYGTLAADALGSAADIHPLGYYTLLWAWTGVFGRSIVIGRLLSVLVGCVLFVAAVRLADRAGGRLTAWWAAVFLALSPFLVHYAHEIRMYGLLALFLLAATHAAWRINGLDHGAAEGPAAAGVHRLAVLQFAVAAALAMYTHTLAVFYLAPLALVPFWLPTLRRSLGPAQRPRRRERASAADPNPASGPAPGGSAGRMTLLGALVAVLLYLPWLIRLPGQLAKVSTAYWTTAPGGDRLLTTLLTFVTNLPIAPSLLPFALLAAVLSLVLAGWQTLRAAAGRRRPATLVQGLLLAYLAFVPPLLMFAVSQFVPVYIERALLPSGVAYLLWVAWALTATEIPRFVRLFAAAALLIGMFIGLQTHLTYRGFPYAPFAEVNTVLRPEVGPDTVIVHSNKLSALPAFFLAPDLPHHYLPDLPGSGSDTLARPTQEVIGLLADADLETAVGAASRVYFIVFRQEIDEYRAQGEPDHPQLAWLADRFTPAGSSSWEDLLVYEYVRP